MSLAVAVKTRSLLADWQLLLPAAADLMPSRIPELQDINVDFENSSAIPIC